MEYIESEKDIRAFHRFYTREKNMVKHFNQNCFRIAMLHLIETFFFLGQNNFETDKMHEYFFLLRNIANIIDKNTIIVNCFIVSVKIMYEKRRRMADQMYKWELSNVDVRIANKEITILVKREKEREILQILGYFFYVMKNIW